MTEYLTLAQWHLAFKSGAFTPKNEDEIIKKAIKAGFWDWFCSSASLPNRVKRLAPKIHQLEKCSRIRKDLLVSFKNCCPFYGPTYDLIQLVDSEKDYVAFAITPFPQVPNNPKKEGEKKCNVYIREDEQHEYTGSWKEILSILGYNK